jgi:GNAT superfamily N-acetyltransferase
MAQSDCYQQLGRSTCGEDAPLAFGEITARPRPKTVGPTEERPRLKVSLSNVRDYRDRYILQGLQKEARMENPGFKLLQPHERSKIMWVEGEEGKSPAGYYVYCKRRRRHVRGLNCVVEVPATFSQVYVKKELRRRGLARRMLRDFVAHHDEDEVWVESPRWETTCLLIKMGYVESKAPYAMWQMLEGMSLWLKHRESVFPDLAMPGLSEAGLSLPTD